ncbi:MAG: CBS domain-containing protein [Chitinophagaceae bacterium]|nr:CBS domain-containing protein [Chitinophagaceae bacterium]
MKVADILRSKGSEIYSITAGIKVYEALKIMQEKNVGALLVMDADKLLGIISERDYARKIILQGKTSHETSVGDIMTKEVITVQPGDGIEKCMELMSEKHIRHLPVVNDDKIVGVISITDVVTAIIQSQRDTITHLEHYISQ